MKIPRRCLRILHGDLKRDPYFLRYLPTDSVDGILDIGAAYGIFSILARLLHPTTKVIAVEPFKKTYDDLIDNVSNLGIKTFNAALGNGDSFYLMKERKTPLCNTFLSEGEVGITDFSVKSYTLAELILKSRFKSTNIMIKLDCEGAEKYLLNNDASCIAIQKCAVFSSELHYMDHYNADDLINKLRDITKETHDYLIYRCKGLCYVTLVRKDFCQTYNLKDKINEIQQSLGKYYTVI